MNISPSNIYDYQVGDIVHISKGEFMNHGARVVKFLYSPYDGDVYGVICVANLYDSKRLIETIPENLDLIRWL